LTRSQGEQLKWLKAAAKFPRGFNKFFMGQIVMGQIVMGPVIRGEVIRGEVGVIEHDVILLHCLQSVAFQGFALPIRF